MNKDVICKWQEPASDFFLYYRKCFKLFGMIAKVASNLFLQLKHHSVLSCLCQKGMKRAKLVILRVFRSFKQKNTAQFFSAMHENEWKMSLPADKWQFKKPDKHLKHYRVFIIKETAHLIQHWSVHYVLNIRFNEAITWEVVINTGLNNQLREHLDMSSCWLHFPFNVSLFSWVLL